MRPRAARVSVELRRGDAPAAEIVLNVHRSHRLDALAERLGDRVATPLGGPFAREHVVVPSAAIGTWLAHRLATRFGVWANPWLGSIAALRDELAVRVLGDAPRRARRERTWAIASALAARLDDPRFAPVRAYVDAEGADPRARRRVELAARIDAVFARYADLRPELVAAWEAGDEPDDWQATLWRDVVARVGSPGAEDRALIDALRACDASRLPPRVSLFDVPVRSPRDASLVDALASRIDVAAFTVDLGAAPLPAIAAGPRVLDVVQRAIVPQRRAGGRAPLADDDASLTLHACHGPMREVQVLRDRILDALDADPTIEPRDVLVLASDVEAYAPFVEAAFGKEAARGAELPFRVVDRAATGAMPVAEALLAWIDVARGRLAITEVIDLLAREPVRARFGLAESDVERAATWLAAANVRWAEDEAHRAEAGQPALRANTWRFGIERLLLGVAAPSGTLFEEVLAADEAEGGAATTLGRVIDFCEALFGARHALRGTKTVAAWCEALAALLDSAIAQAPTNAWQHARVRDALAAIAEGAEGAGAREPIGVEALRGALARALDERPATRDFASGGVTFCALRPDRCVPARVIALLGMNDGAFPRATHPLSFDRTAQEPRPGDPSPRDDDRLAFARALAAAGDRVIVTYTGRDPQTNAERAPSVLISALLDDLEDALDAADVRARLVVTHPLHAFSARYFDRRDPRLFSYADRLCAGARASLAARAPAPPLFPAPIAPVDRARGVALDELVDAFRRPARALLRRLGIALAADAEGLDDREPLWLSTLQSHRVGSALLRRALRGDALRPMPADLRASGDLPLGAIGDAKHHELASEVEAFAAAVRRLVGDAAVTVEPIDLLIERTRLTGSIDGVTNAARVAHPFSQLGARHQIEAWIRHLALACASGARRTSWIVARDGDATTIAFDPPDDPRARLADLIALLARVESEPLPIFPDAALTFVEKRASRGDAAALGDARTAHARRFGDAEDAYVKAVWRDEDPFADAARFAALAQRVYGPLVAARREEP